MLIIENLNLISVQSWHISNLHVLVEPDNEATLPCLEIKNILREKE